MAHDLDYLLDRSTREAVRAIQSPHPAAAAVHQELCLLYTGAVLARLVQRRYRISPAERSASSIT